MNATDVFQPEESNDDEEDDLIPLSVLRERLNFPESLTFEDYVNVDDDVLPFEQLTEAELLTQIMTPEGVEDEEDFVEDEPVNGTELPVCTLTEARSHLQELRRFFESKSTTTDVDFSSINRLDSTLSKSIN